MNGQVRKKKNLLEREAKLNHLAKIFHRKLETLLIYIRVPNKKQEKLFFDDFFNVEEVSAYINTVEEGQQCAERRAEQRVEGRADQRADRACSGESLNLNAENEIKSNKDIFITFSSALILVISCLLLAFEFVCSCFSSNLIDVRKELQYACDNVFLNDPKKGKYKIDAKSRSIYLREYYDLFCSASCMNYNLHLLREIAKNGKNGTTAKGGGTEVGGGVGRNNLKTKCQLIYIMFLTFFPIFKFHDINVLLNNLEFVRIQNNRIFLEPGGGGLDGKDKGEAGHPEGRKATKGDEKGCTVRAVEGDEKGCTVRTVEGEVKQRTRQLRKTLFPVIVEKREGGEDSEGEGVAEEGVAEEGVAEEGVAEEGVAEEGVAEEEVTEEEATEETTEEATEEEATEVSPTGSSPSGPDEKKLMILPLRESFRRYVAVNPEEEQNSNEDADSCPKRERGKASKSKSVRFNEDVQTYEYFKDERVDVYSVARTSMEATQGGDSLPGEEEDRRKDHPGVSPEGGETTEGEGPGEETNGLSVTPQHDGDENLEEATSAEAAGEGNPSDGEMAQVYEQVRQSIFTNRKHFFEDVLGKTLFDSSRVIGFDYEGGEEQQRQRQQREEEEDKEEEKHLRTSAAQRMSEINLKHDRERKGRRIVLLSQPGGGAAARAIPQASEGGGEPDDGEAEAKGVMSGEKDDAAPGGDEKDDAALGGDKEDAATPVDGKREDAPLYGGEEEDAPPYRGEGEEAAPSGGQVAPASDSEEDTAKLHNLLMEKKKKISEQYDEAFNRGMAPFLFAGAAGESGGEECPGDLLKGKDKSADEEPSDDEPSDDEPSDDEPADVEPSDEEQLQQVKKQSKYTYGTDKCSAYDDMSLYVVLWDILTGVISKYTVHYFEKGEFVIPKCPTEVERDRKNEFLRNVSEHMPRTIHPIAPIIFNVCQTFSFGKPLLPFKKIVYESIIYIIAAALGRHKVELIPSGEMGNIRRAEEFLTVENGMDGEELDELATLFYQHVYY
ncbi:RTR1 domain-containing protein, putative [Plasmodium vivax]|uniref:RTR1 domain-containing protein, putative n=1 Tax=Plasmodium vivax TaxID=5855 RepID=A0A564ZPY8_PLAVI|nr:RTR1 domain-containing protein, putative [Plasmodium vivax]